MSRTIYVIERVDDFFDAAAQKVVEIVTGCREEGRICSIALAGGSTPRGLYQLLAHPPYGSQVDWSHLRIFWGDERQVPPDHPDSNYRMAQEALLAHVPLPLNRCFELKENELLRTRRRDMSRFCVSNLEGWREPFHNLT